MPSLRGGSLEPLSSSLKESLDDDQSLPSKSKPQSKSKSKPKPRAKPKKPAPRIPSNGINGLNGLTAINGLVETDANNLLQAQISRKINGNINRQIDSHSINQVFAAAATVPKNQHFPCSYIAEADLPTDIGHFRLRAYRIAENAQETPGGLQRNRWLGTEPCLIYCKDKPLFGDQNKKNVPIRIHDQCFTSEVFRSKRCDCKEQLNMALKYIRNNGGAIIYLQQEGRGIGLANKVAAYALQDIGLDTVDANTHLGFPEDCRQYGVVPSILRDMGIESIRLITNNPRKIDRLKALGIDVQGTIPMVVDSANPYNRRYLQTKKDRMNHSNFADLLSLDNIDTPLSPDTGTSIDKDDEVDEVVNIAMNGMMKPRKKSVQERAAAAVTSAIMDTGKITLRGGTEAVSQEQLGVTAAEDGYCMGRQSVEDAIAAVARGEIVVVVDDMDRENEGDFIMAADLATPETIATIVKYSSGVICVGMQGERMDRLELPAMLVNNEDPKGTAFSVTVDAAPEHGISTGISAKERAITIRLLANESTKPIDLRRPGHIFPLRAREGGVLTRDGHTEASVDLARLAGCHPSGVLCEIVSEEHPTEMARLPELKRMCKEKGWVMTSIVDIAQYRRDTGDL